MCTCILLLQGLQQGQLTPRCTHLGQKGGCDREEHMSMLAVRLLEAHPARALENVRDVRGMELQRQHSVSVQIWHLTERIACAIPL